MPRCIIGLLLFVALDATGETKDQKPAPSLVAPRIQPQMPMTDAMGRDPNPSVKQDARTKRSPPNGPTSRFPEDPRGTTPPEYKRPNRWGLTAGMSQRHDWLTGKERFEIHEAINAKRALRLPEWLDAALEQRTRYETFDTPWQRGQTGAQDQIPLQTVLWMEAHTRGFRAGFEFWDARQFGAAERWPVNNTMVNVGNFAQLYGAFSTTRLGETGLGFEAKAGRMTLDLGSRRLVARNVFRNTTNTFTGILIRLRDPEAHWHLQLFANQPVQRLPKDKAQLVNNDWAWDSELPGSVFAGGLLESEALPFKLRGELYIYYLGENSDTPLNRQLITPGLRFFKNPIKGEWDFEGETIGQTGSARLSQTGKQMDVEAYFEHLQVGYTFNAPLDPRLLIQYDYATGGSQNGVNRSFDTLYGARRWEYGPTGIFGPFSRNNINSPGARLFLVPHRDLSTFIAYRAWWMADSKAGWQPAGLIDPTGSAGDFMGQTIEFATRWDAHENIALEGGWTALIKGDFAKNAPGAPSDQSNVNYFYVQSEIRF